MGGPVQAVGARICDKFGSTPVAGGRFLVQNNEWGADDGQCIQPTGQGFRLESGDHAKPDGPAAYPSVMSGCWMRTRTQGTTLPARIDGLGAITSSIAATTTDTRRHNLAYDIWADWSEPWSGGPGLAVTAFSVDGPGPGRTP